MSRTYAVVYDGTVREIILPVFYQDDDIYNNPPQYKAGDYIPVTDRYAPGYVDLMVEITGMDPMPEQNWTYDGKNFAPYQPPVPTAAEILAYQSSALQQLNRTATQQRTALTNRVQTLQDAVDNIGVEGMEEFAATPEEQAELPKRKAQLVQWKNYAILLGRVTSQPGWPPDVVWPKQPSEGMDLTISAFSESIS